MRDMSNAANLTKTQIKNLKLRLEAQRAELTECTTAAQSKCVAEAIADTERQLVA
jgi:hypothetical protein